MYLENLKRRYEVLKNNLRYLESSGSDLKEINSLKKHIIEVKYNIKKEELFNKFHNGEPLKYHFIDDYGLEDDIMITYGDKNYENAYRQIRDRLFKKKLQLIFNLDDKNIGISSESKNDELKDLRQKMNLDTDSTDYVIFKKGNEVHIISNAPIYYIKENSDLIKRYMGSDVIFKYHNEDAKKLLMDGVLVSFDKDSVILDGNYDEYESTYDVAESTLDGSEPQKKYDDTTLDDNHSVNVIELVNLAKNDKYEDIIKLIGFYKIKNVWNAFDSSLENGEISKEDFDVFVSYLKNKLDDRSAFYVFLFNDDYKKVEDKYSAQAEAQPFIPADQIAKRKTASEDLIKKAKLSSRTKKIAVSAFAILLLGAGTLSMCHANKMNVNNNSNSEIVQTEEKNNEIAGKTFEIKNNENNKVNEIHAGDTVYRSADEAMGDINGVPANGYFKDSVVAVYDPSSDKVIVLTPDNIDDVQYLLDDESVPKAFGSSFEDGFVDGWKTGSGYKTIFDEINKNMGGKKL